MFKGLTGFWQFSHQVWSFKQSPWESRKLQCSLLHSFLYWLLTHPLPHCRKQRWDRCWWVTALDSGVAHLSSHWSFCSSLWLAHSPFVLHYLPRLFPCLEGLFLDFVSWCPDLTLFTPPLPFFFSDQLLTCLQEAPEAQDRLYFQLWGLLAAFQRSAWSFDLMLALCTCPADNKNGLPWAQRANAEKGAFPIGPRISFLDPTESGFHKWTAISIE